MFYTRIEKGVGEVHDEIEDDKEYGVKERETHREGIIRVEGTVDEVHAEPGNLENVLDHE
jgi:hypothetical protein